MKQETLILRSAEKMTPLIRSIAKEVEDRSREIERLESELEQLSARTGDRMLEVRRVEEDLFLHRRGMERIEKELARLGCRLDEDHPERIVCSIADGEATFAPREDETERQIGD